MQQNNRRLVVLIALLIAMGLLGVVIGPSLNGYWGVPIEPLRIQDMPNFVLRVGQAFEYNVLAAGGSPPFLFYDDTSQFEINPETGHIAFTPTEPGTHHITLTVIDEEGTSVSASFTLTIH